MLQANIKLTRSNQEANYKQRLNLTRYKFTSEGLGNYFRLKCLIKILILVLETPYINTLPMKNSLAINTWWLFGSIGLAAETFLARTPTIGAIPKLAKYLQMKHGFEYLLPEKLLSDLIEGHLGWYRQVNRGNFYISVEQLPLAEKKIRCLNLLQQYALLAATNLGDDDLAALDSSASNHV